jgi:glycerol-3-phosphate O-acyltransferase
MTELENMAGASRAPGEEPEPATPPIDPDPWTAMLQRFNAVAAWFARKVFSHIQLSPEEVEAIREGARAGTIVYVMRYPSILDTLLVNTLLLREGLPLAHFSNGTYTVWLRPLRDLARIFIRRLISFARRSDRQETGYEAWYRCGQLVASRKPVLLFLRGSKLGLYVRRTDALEAQESEKDYLAELIRMQWNRDQKIFLVPLAVFWRSGPRQQSRTALSSIFYGVKERPGDLKKFLAFLLNYHDLFVRVGRPIDLKVFVEERSGEGKGAIVKKVRRALQLFLYREEKVVHGPVIKPRRQIRDIVVGDPETLALMDRIADATGEDVAKLRKRAEKYFVEIAANFHGTYIAFLDLLFTWIHRRTFSGIEVTGLEKVAEYGKHNPLVLIPCHRSHFDYLFISSLFYHSRLSPPHIAAGINLSFWPMGPLFRGAGAYFLRRTFGDNELYKTVFHKYMTFLIKQGYSQEFFIEGGRSRTGKLLSPQLGMLGTIIDTYLEGVRRDLYFVPVGITYERLAEERAYVRELAGEKKEKESIRSIVEARTVLKRKFGKVYINFGEPISLHDAMGNRLETLRGSHRTAEGRAQTRTFVEEFAYRILRAINAVTTATVSSLAATALLARDQNAIRRNELIETILDLRSLLRVQDAMMSDPLGQEELNFDEMINYLVSSDLMGELKDGHEVVYTYDEKRRRSLDFYKNNILHYLVVPSILAQALRHPTTRAELSRDLFLWVRLFRNEFFLPDEKAVGARAEIFLGHFIAEKLIQEDAAELQPAPDGGKRLALYAGLLANFRESYFATADAVLHLEEWPIPEKKLLSRINLTFEKYYLLKEVRRPEASNRVIHKNALRCLVGEGYLDLRQVGVGKGKSSILYDRGARFNELADVRQLLARSLESHDT